MSNEHVPFWKKEIAIGRRKPRPADEPRRALDDELEAIKQAAIAAVTPHEPDAAPAPRPLKPLPPEPEPEPEPTTIEADEWVEPKVPFWKKELGGKKKEPKPAKRARVAADKVNVLDPAAGVEADAVAAEPKVPFWKKELGGKKKQPRAEKPQREQTPRASHGVPFWRREIAIGRKRVASPATEKVAQTKKPKREGRSRDLKLALPKLQARPRKIKRDKSGRALPQKHKKLVGLKVGASQIAAARISNNGVAELQQLAREDIEHGIVVGGELREPEKLAESLRRFFKANGLPRRGVRLGIANNRIGVRTFEIVGVDDAKQLDNAIRFRAQEALPIPIEEAVLDYRILDESTDAEGQTVKRVLLVVAYRELVDRYVSACSKAGIELVGIDLEAFALLRAMGAPREDGAASDAAVVVVSIGHDRSTFAVSDGRVCEFTRVLEWGGSQLNVAIAREIDKAPSEAEPFKRELDLYPTATAPTGLTQEQFVAVREAVRRQIQSFARELVSSLQFYQNQPGSLGIGEIVVTGGTAHLPGLADELQRLIGVTVRVGDPLARLRVGKKIEDEEQLGSLAIAIGLGIED